MLMCNCKSHRQSYVALRRTKIISARFWIEAIGNVLQGPKKERVELAVRDEDGVKRKLVFFESFVELPLEVGDTILCVGIMASEY